jgi:hypothetical protein
MIAKARLHDRDAGTELTGSIVQDLIALGGKARSVMKRRAQITTKVTIEHREPSGSNSQDPPDLNSGEFFVLTVIT